MSIDKNKIEQVKQKINNTNAAVTKEGLVEICNILIEVINQLNDTTPDYESIDVTDGYYVDGTKVVSEQQPLINALGNTTGGIDNGIIIQSLALYDQTIANNNNMALTNKINEILNLVKTHGLCV